MKKYMYWVYIVITILIAVITSAILYKGALSSYMLDSRTDVYHSTVMLLTGMFALMDLFIASMGIFLGIWMWKNAATK